MESQIPSRELKKIKGALERFLGRLDSEFKLKDEENE